MFVITILGRIFFYFIIKKYYKNILILNYNNSNYIMSNDVAKLKKKFVKNILTDNKTLENTAYFNHLLR